MTAKRAADDAIICVVSVCVDRGYPAPDDYLYHRPVAMGLFPIVLQTLPIVYGQFVLIR